MSLPEMNIAVRGIALLLIVLPRTLCPQSAPPNTPAVRNWLYGIEARRYGFEKLRSKLKSFADGPTGQTPGAVPASLGCPLALESALVVALAEAHIVKAETEEFHLLIKGRHEKEFLDIAYTYNQRGALQLAGLMKLPKEWTVAFQPGEANANKFVVVTDDPMGCIFQFDSSDPFASKAISKDE